MIQKGKLFFIHSVAGLVSGLFILVLSISGAALVFYDELDCLQYPYINSAQGKIISTDNAYGSLQKEYPHAYISNCSIAAHSHQAFVFTIFDSSYKLRKKAMQVFIHPATGGVLKIRGGSEDVENNFMSWVAKLHNSFHAGKTGEWLLGFFAIVFLLSIITGIILYRKSVLNVLLFRKTAFKKGNLHQVIGVYALLFNLMICVTGFWMQRYVFKKDFYASNNYTPVFKPSVPLFFSLDSVLVKIKNLHPDFTAYVIYFAQNKKSNTAVYGSRSGNSFIHNKKFADVILLDSAGAISKTRFVNEISAGDRYDIINSQIHFGKYGGMPVKIIYSLFGLTGGLLSITGFLIWLKRKKRSN